MGVSNPLTSPLPIHRFFSRKFMMKSCFFGGFRVFSSVNFPYAQPMLFVRETSAVPVSFFAGQKKTRKTDFSIFRATSFLINL